MGLVSCVGDDVVGHVGRFGDYLFSGRFGNEQVVRAEYCGLGDV